MAATVRALQNEIAGYRAFFEREGYLILPNFFSAETVDLVQAEIDRVKRQRPQDVVIDNLETGERTVLGLMAPERVAADRMKVNDLYLTNHATRELALAPALVPVLWALLGHVPALCNSLYLEKGSEQAPHVDSLYMTPRTPKQLIASWVALEDAEPDAGPLEYFPGSHLIAPMVFSDGSFHAIEAEMGAWGIYMNQEVTKAGLPKQWFCARKGDVFIWHANFLHGGGPIGNRALTRKSCVFHYFSEGDARRGGDTLVPEAGGFWIDRAPQPLPLETSLNLPFSEKSYLQRYPDVAQAVRAGIYPDGRTHYEMYGKGEGRLRC